MGSLLTDADAMFQDVCGLDREAQEDPQNPTVMTRKALVLAQGADFKLFEKMDIRKDGAVEASEWHEYLEKKFKEKGEAKGIKWLKTLLHSLGQNLQKELQKQEEEREEKLKQQEAIDAAAEAKAAAAAAAEKLAATQKSCVYELGDVITMDNLYFRVSCERSKIIKVREV